MGCRQGITANIVHYVITSDLPDFHQWRIGLTNDVAAVYREWHRPSCFMVFRADSQKDAREIEEYFIRKKGMLGGITGELDAERTACVCLFRAA